MAEEKTEKAEQPPVPTQEVQVVAPVPVKKSDPMDELADTIDQFFSGIQSASVKSMKTILTQFREKTDAVITKLDGGDPPKKQG